MKIPLVRFIALMVAAGSAVVFASVAYAAQLTVGGKNFTEQLLLSNMTAQYLSAKGYDVALKNGLGSVVMRQGLESQQLDIAWEYTGTSLIIYNKIHEKLDAQQTYDRVKQLDGQRGLVWLTPAKLENTYAFAMQKKRADAAGIHTVSDLAQKLREKKGMTLGSDMEFVGRHDGLRPMQKHYDFSLGRANIKQMDAGLVYTSLRDGLIDVGLVYTTDGRNQGFDFKVLDDDKHFFPSYAVAPVVRKPVLDAHPALVEALNALSEKIDTATMRDLNARVDIEREPVSKVAGAFLKAQGLVK